MTQVTRLRKSLRMSVSCVVTYQAADPSFPNLPPPNIDSVDRPLGRWNSKVQKTPEITTEIPAEVVALTPGTPWKWLQTIGECQRQQILKLDFCERKPLVSQSVLNSEFSFPS